MREIDAFRQGGIYLGVGVGILAIGEIVGWSNLFAGLSVGFMVLGMLVGWLTVAGALSWLAWGFVKLTYRFLTSSIIPSLNPTPKAVSNNGIAKTKSFQR